MKRNIPKLLLNAATVLTVLFLVATVQGWHVYNTTLNAAPFRLWVLIYALEYLLPALVLAGIGIFLKNK